jgi:hypothetical protein
MVQLIKNIEAGVVNETIGNVNLISSLSFEIQREDYIDINGVFALIQNFSQIPITKRLRKPLTFGYKPPIGITQQNIEISY